ncbi:MAG TPA: glycosyltransferase, partial [Polyangiales bacterium]|nr:glycosyltransferase [Polyangiales bacterium]
CVAAQHSCLASWWAAVKGGALPREFAWRRDLVEAGLKRASAIVAPSVAFASETARTYDVHVTAVHNGRRPALAAGAQQADFVVTAGRLWDEGKNVAALDAAAARLPVPFQAAGPQYGPNGASIALRHLWALGEVSSTRLCGLFAARPIFASAALYEPFGLSVLEAAYAGSALVLSDIPTHREMWGGAAIFIPARDDSAFASAVQDLLDDPDERQQLGQLARARAQHYTPERMARGMATFTRVSRSPTSAHRRSQAWHEDRLFHPFAALVLEPRQRAFPPRRPERARRARARRPRSRARRCLEPREPAQGSRPGRSRTLP